MAVVFSDARQLGQRQNAGWTCRQIPGVALLINTVLALKQSPTHSGDQGLAARLGTTCKCAHMPQLHHNLTACGRACGVTCFRARNSFWVAQAGLGNPAP
jgi:hypothetical protein